MGAALTQHPELFQAVVSHVGLYDMLRCELDPNGTFNITEFGTVKDQAQFEALFAYSPYHHVKNGTDYPAVLLLTGEHDGRVNPAHSRKMTARLQAATRSRRPVLLRTSGNTGHGLGTPLEAHIAELADVYSFLFDQLGVFYSEVDRGPWSGAVTPTSAVVKARLAHGGLSARLVYSEDELFRRRAYTAPVVSSTNDGDVVTFRLTDLRPDARYHYVLEVNGRPDRGKRGELRTFPEGRASFTIAFASCARTGSTSDVFDRIREHRPLFYLNMGDFHYLNIATNLRSRFRAGYDSVLASPQQADLYRHIPFVYMWDDHDFGGNNTSRESRSHIAARLTYQEYVPHYPLAAGQGDVPIYQSFNVGRVKFILTDLRSERDNVTNKDDAAKSMMGRQQKAWFKHELLDANGKFPLICWVSSVPWLGEKGTNYYRGVKTNQYGFIHHTNLVAANLLVDRSSSTNSSSTNRARRNAPPLDEDHWSMFATERREIADFVKSNHISGVCILHGDSHMLAADDGRYGNYATGGGVTFPVMCAAPLDQDPSIKGGPYSEGVYRVRKGEGCFGLLTVTDNGDRIDVAYSGRNNRDEEKIRLHFSVPGNPTPPSTAFRSP
jgi:alkaline phosphatase D